MAASTYVKRNLSIVDKHDQGVTFKELAAKHGISAGRVAQIFHRTKRRTLPRMTHLVFTHLLKNACVRWRTTGHLVTHAQSRGCVGLSVVSKDARDPNAFIGSDVEVRGAVYRVIGTELVVPHGGQSRHPYGSQEFILIMREI